MGTFDQILRFKASPKLKARLLRIAYLREKKLPELGREALLEFAQKEEVRLGIARKAS